MKKIMKNKLCDISIADYYLRDTSTECRSLRYKLLSDDPDQRPLAKEALQSFDWFRKDQQIINNLLSLNGQYSCQKKLNLTISSRKRKHFKLS
jgi:hypothetical protein